MAPFFTDQLSGCSLAFQPSRVLPSNMLIHPSLPATGAACSAARHRHAAKAHAAQKTIAAFFMTLILSKLTAGILTGMRLYLVLTVSALCAFDQSDFLNHNRPLLDAHN